MNQNNIDTPSIDSGNEIKISKEIEVTVDLENLKQDVIATNADKLRIVLMEEKKNLKAQRDWITPFTLFISLGLALLTTEFKDSLGLSKYSWEAVFVLISLGTFLWLVIEVYRFIKVGNNGNDIDKIIDRIKSGK